MTKHYPEQEAAERLGVSIRTLQKWRLRGGGPVYRKFGSAVRYGEADLEAFIEAAARTSTADSGPKAE